MADKVRIDKYLWSIRIFKSRTLATDACKEGKIKLHEENAKPSTMVTIGDVIDVVKDGFKLKYKVVQLIEKRVSPILAKPCYEDLTPEDEINKYKSWFIGKGGPERRERGAGRPTKRDRREIDDFKDYYEGED
ncbi:MAG: RNA-binding S4 domain-containing protein [Saprospiraceae bacterium]|nr:RNA-binding S4 domain-containing protein [Candidatus Opimibacter skivensis]MBL0005847.1 RNA-binding S4 domain-containing protein [Candidatus Opimibacter skivensis]